MPIIPIDDSIIRHASCITNLDFLMGCYVPANSQARFSLCRYSDDQVCHVC